MDWDQIESKWAAMTRRVRGDMSIKRADVTGTVLRSAALAEATTRISADCQSSEIADQKITMSAQ